MDGGPPQLAHLKLNDLLRYHYVSNDIFDGYTKFTSVRDPYDRIVSFYRYCGYSSVISFKKFVLSVLTKEIQCHGKRFYFFRPQIDYVEDEKGDIGVDFFIKLEEFSIKLTKMLSDIGVRDARVIRVNSSESHLSAASRMARTVKRRLVKLGEGCFSSNLIVDSSISWDKDMRDIVQKIYYRDFEAFGYNM